MTPQTIKRATLHKKGYPYPRAIVDTISFYTKNEFVHKKNKKIKVEVKVVIVTSVYAS